MNENILSLEVQEPWLECIAEGTKIVEARVGTVESYRHYLNKYVLFYSDKRNVWVKITDILHYKTLKSYISNEGWFNVAPHTNSKKEAIKCYKMITNSSGKLIYSKDNVQKAGGIVVLVLKVESV